MLRITGLISLLFILTFTGCKKDEDTPPATSTPSTTQKLSFHIHNVIGNRELNYDSVFTDNSGRKIRFEDFRYYISNIVLIKNDNSEVPLTGKVLLVKPEIDTYELGQVAKGSYKGFRFFLGIDSATNHSDITAYPSSNPLASQSPTMHWSWNAGYIFMRIDGKVDTTLSNSGTPDYDMFYHIGLDSYLQTLDFSTTAFNVGDTEKEILIKLNVRELFNNVDMRTENRTHTMGNTTLATKIKNNMLTAFTAE